MVTVGAVARIGNIGVVLTTPPPPVSANVDDVVVVVVVVVAAVSVPGVTLFPVPFCESVLLRLRLRLRLCCLLTLTKIPVNTFNASNATMMNRTQTPMLTYIIILMLSSKIDKNDVFESLTTSIRMAKFVKWLHIQIVCDLFVVSTKHPSSDQAL